MPKVLVIGAGIFGASIATELSEDPSFTVDLIESQASPMMGASYANHNRLHLGYHYLRCPRTARQSVEGLLSFLFYFGSAVRFNFPNYYAIARHGSKSSPRDFVAFCKEVGIAYKEEMPDKSLLARDMVETCFRVPEPVFDYDALKGLVLERLAKSRVTLRTGTACSAVDATGADTLRATVNGRAETYDHVINCSYHALNLFNDHLGVERIKTELQDVLIPHFLYPAPAVGLTVMDGEFCSVMPKGFNKNEFILYHVKNSVLSRGFEPDYRSPATSERDVAAIYEGSYAFFPFLRDARPFGNWRTTRAIVRNDNDSRLSEIFTYPKQPRYISILSGKISTCIQVAGELRQLLHGASPSERL